MAGRTRSSAPEGAANGGASATTGGAPASNPASPPAPWFVKRPLAKRHFPVGPPPPSGDKAVRSARGASGQAPRALPPTLRGGCGRRGIPPRAPWSSPAVPCGSNPWVASQGSAEPPACTAPAVNTACSALRWSKIAGRFGALLEIRSPSPAAGQRLARQARPAARLAVVRLAAALAEQPCLTDDDVVGERLPHAPRPHPRIPPALRMIRGSAQAPAALS
jgi:hypothetical protein